MYSEKAALKVRHFLESYCKLSKHPFAGQPLKLLPWQWDELIKPLYGTSNEDGTRQYKRAGVWIPKKNGKSSLMSGLCLYHLLEYPGSEVYTIASDVMQANIIFGEAANMIETSPALNKRLWVRRNVKTVEDKKGKSIFRVLSSEPEGKSGYNANLIIFEELAEWGSHAREVFDRLKNAGIARLNSLQIVISTPQYDRESVGFEQYSVAKKIKADPKIDPTFLPLIYEVGQDEDWRLPENWWKANPSCPAVLSQESFYEDYKAVEANPVEETRFRTFRCGQWVGHSEQWIPEQIWDYCGQPFDPNLLVGKRCYLGLDLARKRDIASYVLLFPVDGLIYLLPRFFIPQEAAYKKEVAEQVTYTYWAKQGWITLTPGDVIDYALIRKAILDDSKKYKIEEIGYDPWNAELLVNQQLSMVDGFAVAEVKQAITHLGPASAEWERLIREKKIRHGGNAILTWMNGNCCVRQDHNDNIMLDKLKSTARVDGIAAAIMALSRHMAKPHFNHNGPWILSR